MESIKVYQQQFTEQFGVWKLPEKSTIKYLLNNIETTETLLDVHGGVHPKLPERMVQNVINRLMVSPSKFLQRLSQEMGVSKRTCQKSAKETKLCVYRVTAVQQLQDTSKRL